MLARLEREKLAPRTEAGKATLLRRVTLDLTGLPPTPDELDAFLADPSPGRIRALVDRLLASPHYGERWARPWLDLARYADTNGYEKDNRRAIWKYRDWVIDALNRDMPFDQFTIEQIAGDMLPNATPEQKIASGFHRNAMTNEEGGVDPEESGTKCWSTASTRPRRCGWGRRSAARSATTTSTTRSARRTTSGCSRSSRARTYDSRTFGDGTRYFEPTLELASAEQEIARKNSRPRSTRLEQELKAVTPAVQEAQGKWEESMRSGSAGWTPLAPQA